MRGRHTVGKGRTTGYRKSQPEDASRVAVARREVEVMLGVKLEDTVRGQDVRGVEGLEWDATVEWRVLFRLQEKVSMTRDTSHTINDHTFLEELELNRPRERAVGFVAWNIRSEWRTRLKGNREILIRNIRRQIGDVQ